jgi:hypothetical protein
MPAAGIADAIDQRMIDKSLKQRIFVNNVPKQKFLQSVSPTCPQSVIQQLGKIGRRSGVPGAGCDNLDGSS